MVQRIAARRLGQLHRGLDTTWGRTSGTPTRLRMDETHSRIYAAACVTDQIFNVSFCFVTHLNNLNHVCSAVRRVNHQTCAANSRPDRLVLTVALPHRRNAARPSMPTCGGGADDGTAGDMRRMVMEGLGVSTGLPRPRPVRNRGRCSKVERVCQTATTR